MLIVEDDENLGELYKSQLGGSGYRVELLSSGEACIDRFRATPVPAVVVLDIKLSGISGISVMRQILATHPRTKIVLHSAYDDFKRDTATWGANAFLIKSFDERKLLITVADVLGES